MQQHISTPEPAACAVVLIDYGNLCRVITELAGDSHDPDHLAIQMMIDLKAYVTDNLKQNVVRVVAFDAVPAGESRSHRATMAWMANGFEPSLHLVPKGRNDAAVALSVEASRILHEQKHVDSFILCTGDSWFVPLVRSIRSKGKFVLVAALDSPSTTSAVAADLTDAYFNGRLLFDRDRKSYESPSLFPINTAPPIQDSSSAFPKSSDLRRVTDTVALDALEVIEHHFGMYDEVYLTPLLRKLTELIDYDDDPKYAINHLETCGAVRLEKRRGFPYNFTVLIVNQEHPDVIELKRENTDGNHDDPDDSEDDREDFVRSEQIS